MLKNLEMIVENNTSGVCPHCNSENTDYFTEENLDALLTYIESVGADVVNPSIGVEQYFAVRYDDIYNLIQ